MKKTLLTILVLIVSGILSLGQQTPVTTANYDLAARFSAKRVNNMVFSTSVTPNWFKNSDKFWYTYQTPQGTFYYIVDPIANTKRPIFDNAKLAAQLTEAVKDPFDAQHIPIRRFRLEDDDKKFTFEIQSTVDVEVKDEKTGKPKKEKKVHGFEIDVQSGRVTEVSDYKTPKTYPTWGSVSPDKKYVVFSRDFNFYYMSMADFEKAKVNDKDSTIVEHKLTTEGTEGFPLGSGNNDFYATDEEKNNRSRASIIWSPDSKSFAFIRTDVSKVKDLWVIDVLAEPRPKLERYDYHMPGEAEAPQSYLYMFNMESKQLSSIDASAFKDQTLRIQNRPMTNAERYEEIRSSVWLGDINKFYLQRTSRDQKRIDYCIVDLNTKTVKPLVEERLNTYVEAKTVFMNPNFNEFVWWSERSGWAHLYLFDGNGNLKNVVTSGEYHVENIDAVDFTQKVIYFTANAKEPNENPYYTHQYRVNFDGSNLRLLNPGDFNHMTTASENGKYYIDNYSRVNTVPKSSLFDNNGRKLMDLEEADLSLLFEAGYKFPEIFQVKAGDGITDLYGVMYKPFDFDSTKLYPVIEYVYPGPQTEAVNASWTKGMDRVDRLAQFGFIVVTVGNRGGHPARSKWYHNYGYGNLRDYGLEDKKVTIERLAAKYPWIDIHRTGIHGHSGGGFMSTAAMLVYPDFFKVAVSCAGNHENNIYNRWWSEQHHGVLETITEKGDTTFTYKIDRNSQIAGNLKGHLLLIHGDIDNNVHPGNTIRMVNALIKANKRFDMLILPGQRHAFGNMTEYFFWKMGDYFCEHLIGDSKKDIDIAYLINN
jgi:Dipeptidyl aminopeptidases/acylaminoacyl-peptidases